MTIWVPKTLILTEVVWIALTQRKAIVMTLTTMATDLQRLLLMICCTMIRATHTSMTIRVPKKLMLIEVVWIALTQRGTIVMTLTTMATDLQRLLVLINHMLIQMIKMTIETGSALSMMMMMMRKKQVKMEMMITIPQTSI
jgi:hypothetical protein